MKTRIQTAMNQLFEIINKELDMDLKYTLSIKDDFGGGVRVEFRSESIKLIPCLNLAWKDFCVSHFAYPRLSFQDGKLTIFVKLGFEYHHWDGGSNGASLGNAEYKEGSGWNVVFDRDRFSKY